MSDESMNELSPSLAAWRSEFMAAAVAHERRKVPFWRRWFGVFAIGAVLGGAGAVAVGELNERNPELPVARPGVTIGYLDLETGDPILCPDGTPLVFEVHNPRNAGDPRCPDGSIPEVYVEQERAYEQWREVQPAGTALSEGPTFSYEIENDDEGG
jgi:hypothetical protein